MPKIGSLIRALTLGMACVFSVGLGDVQAQALRVATGASSKNVSVAVNRAIVLESVRTFSEVSVANPGIADVAALSDKSLYILGKSPGRTTLTLLGANGKLITNVDISVAPDVAEFKERLNELLPGEPIEIRSAADGLVLSGKVSGSAKLSKAIELANRYAPGKVTNLMSVGGTQQVMLRIRFAEMQRNTAKELGVNLGLLGNTNNGRFQPIVTTGSAGVQNTDGTGAQGVQTIAGLEILRDATTFGGIGGFLQLGDVLIGALVDALEQKGLVKTLAEPNLVALSGDTANFLAGGEIPIPIFNDGDQSILFKPFGIGLSFTPTVIDDDLINLEMETEVSAIDPTLTLLIEGIGVPGFTVRRATTTVELRDGQTIAIAGLLQDSFDDTISQLPLAGDIPILGTLFRSSDFQRNQSELVILATPYLVTPVDGDNFVLPTDRVRIPREEELFFFGKSEMPADVEQVATQNFDGPYGYIVE